jgi:signal transduction histidine kinase
MASPIRNRQERGQDGECDARSDGELRDANQYMREFLAELGHELRTPLGAICNALQVLALAGDDPDLRESARGLMERQTQCIGRLVDDLLEVARVEHGKIKLRKEPLDLKQSVDRAIETVRASILERGQQLEVTLPRESVSVTADAGRLEQVLNNLLNNAVKYTQPGGRIWLSAESGGGGVVLRIRDTGIGIAAEMLPYVFDSFWQVEQAIHHSQGGLGIGLALVRKLVEMHGGSVSASSPGLGRGSEFVVRLPPTSTPQFPDAVPAACERSVESPSVCLSSGCECGDAVDCLTPAEMAFAQSKIPSELSARKSALASPSYRAMNCKAADYPLCNLNTDDSLRDSCPPAQQILGPRTQWRGNGSVQ